MTRKVSKNNRKKVKKKKEDESLISDWHRMTDKEFDNYMYDLGLMYYENKYTLDEEVWTDFVSFRQSDWGDIL